MASFGALVVLTLIVIALGVVMYLSKMALEKIPMAEHYRTACRVLIFVCALLIIASIISPGIEPIF